MSFRRSSTKSSGLAAGTSPGQTGGLAVPHRSQPRAVDRLRRNGFREMDSLDSPVDPHNPGGESRVNRVASEGPDPEEQVRGAPDRKRPWPKPWPNCRPSSAKCFLLKEKSGLTMAEIAEMTGVSANTVKSRLRYALEKLRTEMVRRGIEP